ncbi:hypothetical protein DL98DRAFT_631114 [Cadophora sp. DSE1049]|nr:hypothetical protein DL98DRAFT_631114 [Cadophora sp. DSE1049]
MKYLLLSLSVSLALAAKYDFSPENSTSALDKYQPYLYVPGESQFATGVTTSYWTCSFVTASDDHQYMVLGHTMYVGQVALARSSILDITDPSYYEMYLYTVPGVNVTSNIGHLDASVGGCGIRGVSDDNLSIMDSYSKHDLINYNFTYEATSAVLFNGALGLFNFGGKECGEWAIPAAKTSGTLSVRGKELTIDPEASFTWYDRQWGDGGLDGGNYTWFQIHLPDSSIRASIWAIDDSLNSTNPTPTTRLATFRFPDGSHSILSFDFAPSSEGQYTSPSTGRTYPTSWTLNFPGKGSIDIQSIRPDQETHNTTSGGPAAYEGFSNVTFNMFGLSEKGFGLAELVKG